jgi:hypothetical protein
MLICHGALVIKVLAVAPQLFQILGRGDALLVVIREIGPGKESRSDVTARVT